MTGRRWARVRALIGVAVLIGLAAWAGPEAILRGGRGVNPALALAGAALTAACTAAACWRWIVLARATGLQLSFPAAVSAYYRSQFLNSTLPGGILGDVDRAVWHARDQRAHARAGGVVFIERVSGQGISLLLAAVVLLGWGPAPGGLGPALAAGCVACVAVLLVVGRATGGLPRWRDTVRLLPPVLTASALMVAGYTMMFVLAARAVGVEVPVAQLIPLALVVIIASAIPVHLAGWGPREGAAAWLFAAAGLGAETGLTISVAYGVTALLAVLPGVVPLIAGRVANRRTTGHRPRCNAAVTRFGAH